MKTKTRKKTKKQFHFGEPELTQTTYSETCAFNERMQKVVVNAEDLIDEDEVEGPENNALEAVDVEKEEEIEMIRKEEEIHPNEVKDQNLVE